MLVLIEATLGELVLDVSFAGYMGAVNLNEQSKRGENRCFRTGVGYVLPYDVKKVSLQGLFVALNSEDKIVLPIGSVEFVQKVALLTDIQLPAPLNVPDSLKPYIGRKTWEVKRFELDTFPCFVKPLDELKKFTGFVAKSPDDFSKLYSDKIESDWNGMLFCSEPIVGEILSEWRCYVHDGKVKNCSNYLGDPLKFPDKNEIEYLISNYKDAPVGYSLDVAVTEKGTKLIECNDAWALGYYGGDFVNYFRIVKERWLEILRKQIVVV